MFTYDINASDMCHFRRFYLFLKELISTLFIHTPSVPLFKKKAHIMPMNTQITGTHVFHAQVSSNFGHSLTCWPTSRSPEI